MAPWKLTKDAWQRAMALEEEAPSGFGAILTHLENKTTSGTFRMTCVSSSEKYPVLGLFQCLSGLLYFLQVVLSLLITTV